MSKKKEMEERERKGGSSNRRLEKNLWRLNSEEENNDGTNAQTKRGGMEGRNRKEIKRIDAQARLKNKDLLQ